MAINKVVYGNSTLIDLTEDTVSADKLLAGETAHDRSGAQIVGSVVTAEVVDNLTTQDATKALSANQGYVLNQNKVDKVTGKGLSTNDYTNEDKAKVTSSDAKIIDYENRGYLGKNKFINSLPIGYTKTINGITFTVNSDHSITVNGTATAQANAYIYGVEDISDSSLKPYQNGIKQTDILSGCPSGGSESTYLLVAGSLSSRYGTDVGSGAELTNFSVDGIRILIRIQSGVTVNNLVFKPMVRNAGADNVYVPYVKSNIELDEAKIDKTASEIQTSDGQFTTVTGGLMQKCVVDLEPIQDLHGYSKPWTGGSGKNKIPLTVDGIKSANSGTWSGNSLTKNGVTFTILTDSDGNVTGIRANGTASANAELNLFANNSFPLSAGTYKLTGGISSTIRIFYYNGSQYYNSQPDEVSFTLTGSESASRCTLTVASGATASNVVYYPMIRLSSVSDATFEPYTNICPISGHTQVQVGNCGKNKLNYNAWKNVNIIRGTAVFENNGLTLTATANDCYTGYTTEDARIPISEGETVTLSWKETSNKSGIVMIFPNGETTGAVNVNNANAKSLSYTATSGVTFVTFRFGVQNSGNTIEYKDIQIEQGSQATEYEPYNGYTHIIDLGGTYYGGTLDAVSGKLTVTHALYSNTWGNGSSATDLGSVTRKTYDFTSVGTSKNDENSIMNCAPYNNSWSGNYLHYAINASTHQTLYLFLPNGTSSDFVFQLCFELATPQTIQLDPQTLETLVGQNDVFAPLDGQSVEEVEYREVLAFEDVSKAFEHEWVEIYSGTVWLEGINGSPSLVSLNNGENMGLDASKGYEIKVMINVPGIEVYTDILPYDYPMNIVFSNHSKSESGMYAKYKLMAREIGGTNFNQDTFYETSMVRLDSL